MLQRAAQHPPDFALEDFPHAAGGKLIHEQDHLRDFVRGGILLEKRQNFPLSP